MQSKISIQQIMDEAAKHEQIATLYKRVAESLSRLNPKVELLISDSSIVSHPPEPSLMNLQTSEFSASAGTQTKFDALVEVLKNSGKAMSKYEIEKEMKACGYEISIETLTSYLSRNKDKKFKNPRRGIWKFITPNVMV